MPRKYGNPQNAGRFKLRLDPNAALPTSRSFRRMEVQDSEYVRKRKRKALLVESGARKKQASSSKRGRGKGVGSRGGRKAGGGGASRSRGRNGSGGGGGGGAGGAGGSAGSGGGGGGNPVIINFITGKPDVKVPIAPPIVVPISGPVRIPLGPVPTDMGRPGISIGTQTPAREEASVGTQTPSPPTGPPPPTTSPYRYFPPSSDYSMPAAPVLIFPPDVSEAAEQADVATQTSPKPVPSIPDNFRTPGPRPPGQDRASGLTVPYGHTVRPRPRPRPLTPPSVGDLGESDFASTSDSVRSMPSLSTIAKEGSNASIPPTPSSISSFYGGVLPASSSESYTSSEVSALVPPTPHPSFSSGSSGALAMGTRESRRRARERNEANLQFIESSPFISDYVRGTQRRTDEVGRSAMRVIRRNILDTVEPYNAFATLDQAANVFEMQNVTGGRMANAGRVFLGQMAVPAASILGERTAIQNDRRDLELRGQRGTDDALRTFQVQNTPNTPVPGYVPPDGPQPAAHPGPPPTDGNNEQAIGPT